MGGRSRFNRGGWRRWIWIAIAVGWVGLMSLFPGHAQESPSSVSDRPPPLPALVTHPLPSTLANWPRSADATDYFDEIQPSAVGYLIWTQLPIRVYVAPLVNPNASAQAQAWLQAVDPAIAAWQPYLPLVKVDSVETADIVLRPARPPLQRLPDGSIRSRSAETRYRLYRSQETPTAAPTLVHRCTILVRPDQSLPYLQAALRHELGHALGIWGHSPQPEDVMYFSQTRSPAAISPRDLHTLQRIYQQPTRLGGVWPSDELS